MIPITFPEMNKCRANLLACWKKLGSWRALFLLVLLSGSGMAQMPEARFKITYLSSENVYLDGGQTAGLRVGDTLLVKEKEAVKAILVVAFVSGHSASCRILQKQQEINIGEFAYLQRIIPAPTPAADTVLAETSAIEPDTSPAQTWKHNQDHFASLSGQISAHYLYWDDQSQSDLGFTRKILNLDLRMRQIGGMPLELTLRTRRNQYHYNSGYPLPPSQENWEGSLNEFSIASVGPNRSWNFQAGRFLPFQLTGLGYIDGLLLKGRINRNLFLGGVAGTNPRWQYQEGRIPVQQYGVFLNYLYQTERKLTADITLAALGSYRNSAIDREFFYSQGWLRYGHRTSLWYMAELDLNRAWRKERTGSGLTVTNLYINTRHDFSPWLSAGLTYDSRQNFWTYQDQILAESLFDDRLRRGVRLQAYFRFSGASSSYLGVGYHNQGGGIEATYSYFGGISHNLSRLRSLLSLQATAFKGEFQDGYQGSFRLAHYFRQRDLIVWDYGLSQFEHQVTSTKQLNHWLGFNLRKYLFSGFFFTGKYQYNWGDNLKGNRLQAGLGYIF